MPSIRLLDLTNLVALSPAKHFFNGLLGVPKWQVRDLSVAGGATYTPSEKAFFVGGRASALKRESVPAQESKTVESQ